MSPDNLNKLIYNIDFINEDIKTLQERLPPNQNVDEYSQYSNIGLPCGNLSLKVLLIYVNRKSSLLSHYLNCDDNFT
jgi:hypothetical protein